MRLVKILMVCLCGLFLASCTSKVKPTAYHITGNKYIIAFNKTSHTRFPNDVVKFALLKKAAEITLKNDYSYFISNITSKRTRDSSLFKKGKVKYSYHWEMKIKCFKMFSIEKLKSSSEFKEAYPFCVETTLSQELLNKINEYSEEGYSDKANVEGIRRSKNYPDVTSKVSKYLDEGYSPNAILKAIRQAKAYQNVRKIYFKKENLPTYDEFVREIYNCYLQISKKKGSYTDDEIAILNFVDECCFGPGVYNAREFLKTNK